MNTTITTYADTLMVLLTSGEINNMVCILENSEDSSVSVTGLATSWYIDPSNTAESITVVFRILPSITVEVDKYTLYNNDQRIAVFDVTPKITYAGQTKHDVLVTVSRTTEILNDVSLDISSTLEDLV